MSSQPDYIMCACISDFAYFVLIRCSASLNSLLPTDHMGIAVKPAKAPHANQSIFPLNFDQILLSFRPRGAAVLWL